MWNRTIPLSLPMFSGVLRPLRTVANRTLRRIGVPRRSCASTPPGGKLSAPLGSSWVKGFLGGSIVGSGLVYVLGDTSDGTMSAAGKGEEAPVELGVLDGRDSELIRYCVCSFFWIELSCLLLAFTLSARYVDDVTFGAYRVHPIIGKTTQPDDVEVVIFHGGCEWFCPPLPARLPPLPHSLSITLFAQNTPPHTPAPLFLYRP